MKKAVMMMVIVIAMMMMIMIGGASASVNHMVGGGNRGWSLNSNLNSWSTSTSFFINDSLVFDYTPDHDVIEVTKSDFTVCRINSPIATYNYDEHNGHTVIPLTKLGRRYFICGRPDHCSKGHKVSIQVQDQQNTSSASPNQDQNQNQSQNSPPVGSHKSLGYSNLNEVASVRNLVQLCIAVLAIMSILALPTDWHL